MRKFTEDHVWMRRAMYEEGGGFVKKLAECLELADHGNYARLETAFPEYCAEYIEVGKRMKEKESKNR